jgi:hypothetical protein
MSEYNANNLFIYKIDEKFNVWKGIAMKCDQY